MKSPKTQLMDGENIVRQSSGGHVTFAGPQVGNVYLTNRRLFFEPMVGKKVKFSINIEDIAECRIVRYSCLLLLIPIMKAVKVFLKNGSSVKFSASDKDGWIVAINSTAQEARKS